MGKSLINGKAYDWVQVIATINGTELNGVKKIDYSEKQEKANNYGAGGRPVSRGAGRIEAEASITIDMTEAEKLTQSAPNRNLLEVPMFDVTVTFENAGKVVTNIIKNCEFTNNMRGLEEGATGVEVELELLPSHIIW